MPPLESVEAFREIVRKSGVVEDARLEAAFGQLTASGEMTADLKKLAELLVRDGVLTTFQATQLLQGKWKRFFVGKYKVLERLGGGGMGQVFLCEHRLMRRRVAVKVLPSAKSDDPASLERFYREARAVAAVDHPNLVRAYDVDQDENLHFLVMEYVDGVNLQDLVKISGPLPVVRACHYVTAACVGLQHAHEMGLVHRDIKPANILVDRSGVVKILDMGLARFFHDADDSLTKKYDENVLGTADYLAPEQAIDSHAVDIRADIYSMGATFYFLLTGQAPFPDGGVAQKLLSHQQREPAPLSSLRPDVPQELVEVVRGMMAKDVTLRTQTPGAVIAALEAWVRSPIPGPSAGELPTWSRAAMGTGGPITSRVVAGVQALNAPPTASATPSGTLPHPLNASGLEMASTPTPGTLKEVASSGWLVGEAVAAQDSPPHLVLARPLAPVASGQVVVEAVPATDWGSFSAAPDSMGRKPTAPQPVRPPRGARGRSPVWRRALLGTVVLGALVAVASGGYFAWLSKGGEPSGGDDGKVWYVKKTGAGPNANRTLATLAGAIDQAKAGETIVILDANIDDPPVRASDIGKGARKGLRIQPGPELNAVTWTPRYASAKGGPALDLTGFENLRVGGLVIELAHVGDCGIAVGASSPGLVIDNVVVRNPRTTGFRFQQLGADPARPALLKNCRVLGDGRYEAGVTLTSGNRSVRILGNRFEGPAGAGVKIDGAATDCEVRNNRIWNCDSGVVLGGRLGPDAPYGVVVASNTVHTAATSGLHVEHALTGAGQIVQLRKNYFYAVAAVVGGPHDTLPGLKTADNARGVTTREGKFPSGAAEIAKDFLPAPNPDDAATFLQPTAYFEYGYQRD